MAVCGISACGRAKIWYKVQVAISAVLCVLERSVLPLVSCYLVKLVVAAVLIMCTMIMDTSSALEPNVGSPSEVPNDPG